MCHLVINVSISRWFVRQTGTGHCALPTWAKESPKVCIRPDCGLTLCLAGMARDMGCFWNHHHGIGDRTRRCLHAPTTRGYGAHTRMDHLLPALMFRTRSEEEKPRQSCAMP